MGNIIDKASATARFIILFSRQYPWLAVVYLLVFAWLVLTPASQPPLNANQNPNSLTPDNSISQIATSAQAKAFKTGNQITIRWDKPVFDTSFQADNRRIAADNISCQLDFCTIYLDSEADILKAQWVENGQAFSKKFRF